MLKNIDDAVDIIKKLEQGAWLIKTDITDAFRITPVSTHLWPFHGIKWNKKYYFFKKLVFGSRSSPNIYSYSIRNILHLLDGFLVKEPRSADAVQTKETLLSIFDSLEIPLSAKKTVGPCKVIKYIGIFLDSEFMEARLPLEKVNRICEFIETFHNRKHIAFFRAHAFCFKSYFAWKILCVTSYSFINQGKETSPSNTIKS